MATYSSQPDETSGVDIRIYQQAPTTSFNDTSLSIGDIAGSTDLFRSLIKFDLSSIPSNATVTSAVLSLWHTSFDGATNSATVNVYRVLRAWDETATWNVYSTGNNWGTAGCANTTSDREATDIGNGPTVAQDVGLDYQLDITLTASKIQEFINGTMTNNGFLIKTSGESDDFHGWNSSAGTTASTRPKLVIEYTVPGSGGKTLLLGVG